MDFSGFEEFEISDLRNFDHEFFQCALNELEETGFMSNRVRQIFASVWLNDLKLNWRSGAKLFEHYLIDYDVFSNYETGCTSRVLALTHEVKDTSMLKSSSQTDLKGEYLKTWGNCFLNS